MPREKSSSVAGISEEGLQDFKLDPEALADLHTTLASVEHGRSFARQAAHDRPVSLAMTRLGNRLGLALGYEPEHPRKEGLAFTATTLLAGTLAARAIHSRFSRNRLA